MKIYDKEIYKRQESMRSTITIIVVFILGFLVGYVTNSSTSSNNNTKENQIINTTNEVNEKN